MKQTSLGRSGSCVDKGALGFIFKENPALS